MTLKYIFVLALASGIFQILEAQESRHPPDIDEPLFPKTIYFMSGENITIPCQATGTPPPSYTWEVNEEKISSHFISSDPVNGTLTINRVSEREVGVYRCLANNTWGTAVSHSTTLVLIESDGFKNKTVLRINATVGESLSVPCRNPPKSVPAAKLAWYTSETGPKDNPSSMDTTNRIGWDETGTMHFAHVVQADQLENEIYTCSSQNPRMNAIIFGSKVKLAVKITEETNTDSKPRILYKSSRKTEEIGKIATLECFFAGKPVPTISWLDKNNREVMATDPRIKIQDFGRRLVIGNTTENDKGQYTCIGNNTLGRQIETVFLNITSRPIWERSPKSQTVVEGSNVTFTCKARAAGGDNPPADPTWFINGHRLQENDTRLVSPTSMFLMAVQRDSDLMNVQCLVENEIGRIFQNTFLNILLPIKFTSRPPQSIRVEKGDLVNLTVSAFTDPSQELSYQWKFEGSDVRSSPEVPGQSLSLDSRTLIIDTAVLSDEQLNARMGTYTCLVSHTYETRLVEVFVRKRDVDSNIMVTKQPDAVIKIGHGDVVNLMVTATTDPSLPLRFLWKQNEVNLHIGNRPEFSFSEDRTTLTINTTSLTGGEMTNVTGLFVCTISNNLAEVNIEVTVQLVDAPVTEGVVVVQASINFWIIAVVLGILILVGAVLLVIFVLRHHYPKRVYLLEKKELKSKLNPVQDIANDSFQTL